MKKNKLVRFLDYSVLLAGITVIILLILSQVSPQLINFDINYLPIFLIALYSVTNGVKFYINGNKKIAVYLIAFAALFVMMTVLVAVINYVYSL